MTRTELATGTLDRMRELLPVLAPELRDAGGVSPVNQSHDDWLLDIFARSTWTGLGEPGDRVVGVLVRTLGAWPALRLLISGSDADEVAGALRECDPSGELRVEERDIQATLTEALERWRPRLSEAEALAHLERGRRIGAQLVTPGHSDWPEGLYDLEDHGPVALWTRGDLAVLGSLRRSVSIVGARASTGYGEHVTMEIVGGLVDRGFAIVSGAAYGIDGMAHRSALAAGGLTIAVLAGGIDRLYPSGHDALLHRIIETGLVVTELPCGFAPTKWRFLQRNRLIAAMSQATAVVEAGWRSGSLNTAHHALELQRPTGAVPGPVTSASSAGCHRLLRETPATCVTTADEVVQLSSTDGPLPAPPGESDEVALIHPFAVRVLDALSVRTSRSLQQLAASSGLSISETTAVIGLLNMNRLAREDARGWRRQ